MMLTRFLLLGVLLLLSGEIRADDAPLEPTRIVGSTIVVKPFSLAGPILRERGLAIKVSTENGSSAAIVLAGEGRADIALTTRPLAGEDRADFPEKQFHQSAFAIQALVPIVPKGVWDSGVRALSEKQLRGVYEREITNWKQLGGADQPIKFYNPAQGHGIWEFFAVWLYGEQRKAPLGETFDPVSDSEEARNSVEFNAGALSIAHPSAVDRRGTYGLSMRNAQGEAVEATVQNIRDGTYPFQRSLYMITAQRPTGRVKKILEFMMGPEGQALVEKSELISPGPQ